MGVALLAVIAAQPAAAEVYARSDVCGPL